MKLGVEHVVMRARGRRHHVDNFAGPLSIKTVLDGRVGWKTGGREVLVDESSFVVLNDGEPYSMEVDVPVPVRTCCVFFRRGFVEQVFRDIVCSDGGDATSMWLDEQYLLLARDLVLLYEETQRQVRRVPASRAGTRLEVFRRVEQAREFMHACMGETLRLDEIAQATCPSTHHFQRMFSAAVGESPHSYLTKQRLNRAHFLLRKGFPVTVVCGLVGYESAASFSALFRRKFGVAPQEIRKIQEAVAAKACYF